ncbi:MAG TPA: hypothetical protein IAC67_05590 [Candidatus Coproplasma excrementipullorum]|nr:hypothetical protein [Candidatus Coproplasma excrementipullorum]
MDFDIIDLTEEEAESLSTIQLKLLRTAQQNKNELYHKLQQEINTYYCLCNTNNVYLGSLFTDKKAELEAEFDYQVAILKEQLIFNMSLSEPTNDDETGSSGSDDSGYIVDYELSYLERYIQVRDYYLGIEDASERMALFAADETAQSYLGSYYTTLYNYLSTYT